MKVAVLPFNAAEGTRPALGRQLANFVADAVRTATNTEEINTVNFLTQIEDQDGPRAAYVNVADTLLEPDWINQMFDQSNVDALLDGMLSEKDGKFDLVVRAHKKGEETPLFDEHFEFEANDVFGILGKLVQKLGEIAEVGLPEPLQKGNLEFGTANGESFLKFLEGYDAMLYIQQTQGRVAKEFSPEPAIQAFQESIRLDPEFVGPFEGLIQLCRLCAQHTIGQFEPVEGALKKLEELQPDDFRVHYALGEIYTAVNDPQKSMDAFEKAVLQAPNEPAIYSRLGMTQLMLGMPVNAERNFRKAVELEGDEKPSLDYLSMVLQQTGRSHEIPGLWKEQIDRNPEDAQANAKYAVSLLQEGKEEEATKAFESAIEKLKDNSVVKRFYAPILAQKGELDRAMDFFEDCLDEAPTDVPLLMEYAQTLDKAGREFEVPRVLRDVLAANPDANTRAMALARLIELEQPKRAEVVEQARAKVEAEDYSEALEALRPLKNWLADYWKMWLLLAVSHNKMHESAEAEDAAKRLIDLYPMCEPAYSELNIALSEQNRSEEAYRFLRYAAGHLPQSLAVHINLALAANRSGHKDEAVQLARQIRESVGKNEDVESALAEIGA